MIVATYASGHKRVTGMEWTPGEHCQVACPASRRHGPRTQAGAGQHGPRCSGSRSTGHSPVGLTTGPGRPARMRLCRQDPVSEPPGHLRAQWLTPAVQALR